MLNSVNRARNVANSMANNGFIDDPVVHSLGLPLDQFTKRCVIIQKDEKGYGLRVSGESPVYVDDVREGGAAWRAGVRSGDKIIKVSGTLVTRHNHGEVVRMIQNCGSYVGLTLLGLKDPLPAPNMAPKPIQITAPQPASESTQQAYDQSKVDFIRNALRSEKERLEKLITTKKTKSDQSEIDKTVNTIRNLEKEIEKMTFDVSRQRHTSMSAENLTTGAQSDPTMAAIANANAKKSHSFGQYDTRAPIMTMESDDENEDFTNNNNNLNNSRRNSSLINSNSKTSYPDISDIPKTVDALHGHCLQMTRWLLTQNLPPHALLFYTMAGHVFPNLAAQTLPSGRKSVQRLAWQIASTWLVKEAPLTFAEFPSDLLDKFAVSLESSQSSLETLFEPYFETTRALIKEQLEKWRKAVNIGLAPPVMPTAKEELYATIELVLNDSNRDIERTVDLLIAHLHSNNASTLAMVIVLLTIGHFVFACQSRHLLFSQTDSNTCHPINPVLKLSIDSTKKHKRATSLPSRNHNNVGHYEAGHHFTAINEITKPIYCAGCYGSIWGTYGLTCPNCQILVHMWCMKSAAPLHQCEQPVPADGQTNDTTPQLRPTKKNRRWNSDRYTIVDMIKKAVASNHDSHAPPLLSSSSSSDEDDDDDALTIGGTAQVSSSAAIGDSTTTTATANSTTPTPPNTIQRSESFRQRRKTVPSYRKRSDPALTTSNTTLAGTTGSPDQILTPDISGSPTTTSPNNWQLSSSEDEDEDQSQNDAQQSPGLGSGQSPTAAVRQQTIIDEDTPPPLPPRQPSEKRRQIHNEIIESEKKHLEALKFIQNIFYKPLKQEQLLTAEQLAAVFRNTKNLLRVHRNIYRKLKTATNSIEQALHDVFCGDLGKELEVEASYFCSRHKVGALDTWKARKKDSRLKNFLDPDLRSKSIPDCPFARLSLEDLLGTVFQRPLRYQLLLDRLLHATPSDSEEYRLLAQALTRCREIGTIVNEETRRVESEQRLQEITRKTDKAQGLILNLTEHCLVHEGALMWRITKQKCVDVLLVLTDKILVILARDSNDRFTLKYHTNPAAKANLSNNKTQHSPIVLLHDLFTRDVATDPTAFFLISTDQDVFYEFAASTPKEKKAWQDFIANTTASFNVSKGQVNNNPNPTSVSKLRDLTSQPSSAEEENKPKDISSEELDREGSGDNQEVAVPPDQTNGGLVVDEQQNNNEVTEDIIATEVLQPPKQSRIEGIIRYVREDECRPPDLISPTRVTVHSEPNFEALRVQIPEQRIAEIDARVKQLLEEKRSILANMRGIKTQYEWSVVSDMGEHDHLSSSAREVTFFDKALSVVSSLAIDGLTRESYAPLVSLREQIDDLLSRITIDSDQSLFFGQQSSDQSSDETAVYF